MYDLIGDIHGHADALQQLLGTLGYARRRGVYRHPDRRAIFLGDFIDRGPNIRETLEIVRHMVESGAALAVMGNHELNALAFHTANPAKPGEHLRPHNQKNSRQHAETMRQVPPGELVSSLDWFRTLPLWLAVPYPEDAKPVFVGHYWLSGSRPQLLRQNIACVDWSVAKGGFLCAYRWDGERELDAGNFVWIG